MYKRINIGFIILKVSYIEHEVQIGGYWVSSYFVFVWTEPEARSTEMQNKYVTNIPISGLLG
jgi:hypothetical protein